MPLVDPFSPVPRRQSTDVSLRSHPARRLVLPKSPRRSAPAAAYKLSSPPKPRWQKLRRLLGLLLAPLIVVAISRLAQFLTVGEVLIGAYALVALVGHIPSRFTFLLACLSLVSVGIQLLVLPDTTRAANTSVFAFLFLVAGTVSLALEARHTATYSRLRSRR